MLNRNAARHLLLVASILLCAFIYAGYSLATRGDAASGAAGAPSGAAAGALRPDAAAARLIPPANGDALSLSPPVSPSTRPPAALPAASGGGGVITGLVPETAGAGDAASAGQAAPGTSLPLPGFSSAASPSSAPGASGAPDAAGGRQSPPVLTLPGMGAGSADGGSGDFAAFDDEDFGGASGAGYGSGESGEVLDGDEGDFAALPGFDAAALSPQQDGRGDARGASPASPPANAPRPLSPPSPPARAAIAPPPSSAVPPVPAAAAAGGTGTLLRPPAPGSAPAPVAAAAAASVDRASVPPPPPTTPPARTPRPASVASLPPGTETGETPDPEPRSDSLRIYVVAPGDTLSSIAMRELGSGFLADNIFLLNRDVIEDPNHLMVGVKIRLPYANPGVDAPGDAAPDAPGDFALRRGAASGNTHTVVRGDTLSSIAQQYYGSSALWRLLYEANRATIPNPNQLSVGMELVIPPYAE